MYRLVHEECRQVSKCDMQEPGVIRVRKGKKGGVEEGKKPIKVNLRQATKNIIKNTKKS